MVKTVSRLLPALHAQQGLNDKWRSVADWCSRYYEERDV
eukprot:gene782-3832_t